MTRHRRVRISPQTVPDTDHLAASWVGNEATRLVVGKAVTGPWPASPCPASSWDWGQPVRALPTHLAIRKPLLPQPPNTPANSHWLHGSWSLCLRHPPPPGRTGQASLVRAGRAAGNRAQGGLKSPGGTIRPQLEKQQRGTHSTPLPLPAVRGRQSRRRRSIRGQRCHRCALSRRGRVPSTPPPQSPVSRNPGPLKAG